MDTDMANTPEVPGICGAGVKTTQFLGSTNSSRT